MVREFYDLLVSAGVTRGNPVIRRPFKAWLQPLAASDLGVEWVPVAALTSGCLRCRSDDSPTKAVDLPKPEQAQAVTQNATTSQETHVNFIPQNRRDRSRRRWQRMQWTI